MADNDDDQLFRQAMAGVKPIAKDKKIHKRPAAKSSPKGLPRKSLFTITRDGDSVLGRNHGVSSAQLKPFRVGDVTPDERVDLHGCTQERAKELITRRLEAAAARKLRCVVVIHGKGLHSTDGVSVLRETAIAHLSSPGMSQIIFGFCTAPKNYGGTGALLVALTPKKKKK